MRKHKYRAWDKNEKRYCANGFSLFGECTEFGLFLNKKGNPLSLLRMNDVIFEQYITELIDKNGKEWCVGDIVRDENGAVGVIEWTECRYAFCYKDEENNDKAIDLFYILAYDNAKLCEIIGNIHKNQNLLEVK